MSLQESQLTTALERVDLRAIVVDLYPDSGAQLSLGKQRISAPWRGGDNPEVVSLSAKTAHDFKTGETWNPWTFLTQVASYSKEDAAQYLLSRYGDGSYAPPKPRQAARRERQEKAQEARQVAYNARQQAAALRVQRTGSATGSSAYLQRKGVAAIFDTHEVAPVMLPDGKTIPGMVYGSNTRGPFIQLALRDLSGQVTGYQRIYDGEAGKRFVAGSKPTGAFVLLQPKGARGVKLPKTSEALAARLEGGFELGTCEGFATGASVCLARPRTFMLCALSANNLDPVLEALRERYGYTRRIPTGRGDGYKQKALEVCVWADFDESGTGQQAAHRAALEHDCYVRVPKFKSGHGDFNDLHAARGLEAVRRTRRVTPDAVLAFAKELAEQKLNLNKHVEPFALPDTGAALIVRAPQESGKTHRLAELLGGSGLRVLVVTHRESLAKNLAGRLRFECYQDYSAHMLRSISRLVICFDSLQKLSIGGELPNYDVLVLDESEQVLEHTTGRHIKRKAANFAALEHYLKTAPRIICADANAGRLTADALRRSNPARHLVWHIHEHHIAAGRRLRFAYDRDDVLDVLEASTVPTWYASDSLRHTRDLDAYLNDPGTLTINSETATTDAAAAYLQDPTREASKYRRMIASPSVQTGLSDDSRHWPHVIGNFTGHSSTPQDAMQAVLRARGAPELTVYATRGRGEAVSVAEAQEGAAAVDTFEAETLGQDAYGTANLNYERLRAEVESRRTRRQANYKQRLVLEAARLGYSITYDVPQDLSASKLEARDERRTALKEAGLERYVRDRVNAERIDETKAKQLDEAYTLAQADRFALEQYQLRAFYVLPDDVTDEDLADMLRRDDYKALRDKVTNYECFIEPREVAEARARGELEAGVLKGDAKAHMLRWEYHQRLGAAVGMDAETEKQGEAWDHKRAAVKTRISTAKAERLEAHDRRKGEIDRALKGLERELSALVSERASTSYSDTSESVQRFKAWCVKNYQALKAAKLVTASLANLKVKPLETIGDSLRRAGLAHSHDGKRGAEKSYALELASVSTMGDYSRPRRKKWDFAQQTPIKNLLNGLLCKNVETPSQSGLISPAENAKAQPLQETYEAAPTNTTGDQHASWKVPGYEALRVLVREASRSETRTRLTEAFRYADSGDPVMLNALTTYIRQPHIASLVGVSA